MKIIYISNSLDHIAISLCDYLFNCFKEDFRFISTQELDKSRSEVSSKLNRTYNVKAFEDEEFALNLCNEADVVIFGHAPLKYISNRIKENKLTLYYSERLFKKGYYRYFNPITMKRVNERFIRPSKNSNFYLLCASSFAALDFKRVGAFKNKMYKWGYQPAINEKNIDELLENKNKDGLEFIWVGRLVKLKHCDDAIKVIYELNKLGYPAKMKIIGTGEEEENLKKLSTKLNMENQITFLGVCNVETTRKLMDDANIFMFTSDFGEGWGVTLNECMNSGVACVASHAAGSTNFLLRDGVNGLLYKSGNVKMLLKKVQFLIDNKQIRENIAREGYKTIYEKWNTTFSHQRLINLIEQLNENGNCDLYEDGPCSKAQSYGVDRF